MAALLFLDRQPSFSLVRRNFADVLRLWNPNSDKFGRLVLEWAF
jgi:hypothetical protein